MIIPFLSFLAILFFSVSVLTHPLTIPFNFLTLSSEPSSSPNTTFTGPRPNPNPNPPGPPPGPREPWESIHCLTKPHLLHIDDKLCNTIISELAFSPTANDQKQYSAATTTFGDGLCNIELKKTAGKSIITISDKDVAGLAVSVMHACEAQMGAGWVQIFSTQNWYVLVYGERL
ncbi:MAG: hypothetical protein LQ343_003981 [Gyalolechia ehrenbergii]|nr:MAG: hypothetical protein LQ343_003981 [Gyalolechia ehrenbergii]